VSGKHPFILLLMGLALFGAAGFILASGDPTPEPQPQARTSSTHPAYVLRDAAGDAVSQTGQPASTTTTCGACHDVAFIASHNAHAGVENVRLALPGAPDDARLVNAAAQDLEMNCFTCHLSAPDNAARLEALAENPAWSVSATLHGLDLITHEGGDYRWNAEAFEADGTLKAEFVALQDPSSVQCGQCHGLTHSSAQIPLTVNDEAFYATTATTGQVISPQRLSLSALNLADKGDLSRSWDVHAERVLSCTECHYSLNNPVYYREDEASQPDHLTFDPRRLDFGEYLHRPSHILATGPNATTTATATMRRCETCHDMESTHSAWLPYVERHSQVVACETCHIPQLYAPALERVDWTALDANSQPLAAYRGVEQEGQAALWTGYQPVILPRTNPDGTQSLAPYNLVAVWRWVDAEGLPVSLADLQAAYFQAEGVYAAEVLALFDADGDSQLSQAELALDSEAKTQLIAQRLQAQGVNGPRVTGEIQPYAVHHNVATGRWATKDCATCHSEESRLAVAMSLGDPGPGGALPVFADAALGVGTIQQDGGALRFQPAHQQIGVYVFGHDSVGWVSSLGLFTFLATLGFVFVHGGLRVYLARRRAPAEHGPMRAAYMYSVYERLWHWLQTAAIFLLIFSGLVIHKPDQLGMFNFPFMVQLHNILGFILLINAALAAFYHFASGQIRQFLPKPRGFFNDAFAQARYYAYGIFKGEPHPLEKTPERKMNPIQQVTYLMLLNVLLPAQVITGVLMWGLQRFPDLAQALGGLPLLAPLHTLIAWLLATFIVLHVYMTTTGHTPLANIKAMMFGWDELESHPEGAQAQGAD